MIPAFFPKGNWQSFPDREGTKSSILNFARHYPLMAFLDSCGTDMDRHGRFEWVIAVASDPAKLITDFEELARQEGTWRFGYLGYGLKDRFEPTLRSENPATIPASESGAFIPEILFLKVRGASAIWVEGDFSPKALTPVPAESVGGKLNSFSGFSSSFTREEYIRTVDRLREHILDGDCYEINLTQEFSGTVSLQDPLEVFQRLTRISPVPFAAYLRLGDQYILSASPERFLQLKDRELVTQPIKGTRPRGRDAATDQQLIDALRHSEKEQAENVMIVDLSRNDLYRSCEVNSVAVPHLFEVQTFPQVHHLVSTVTGRKRQEVTAFQAIQNAFPPGSMTGAPKVRVCELIEQYERSARGIYAGSVGYFTPDGDFDLNVVIRTLIYDAATGRVSYHVGGAITYDSDAESEYEETIVKAKAIELLFEELS